MNKDLALLNEFSQVPVTVRQYTRNFVGNREFKGK